MSEGGATELERTVADLDWWKALVEPLGCDVIGWTFRTSAAVIARDGRYITINSDVRDLLIVARAAAPLKD